MQFLNIEMEKRCHAGNVAQSAKNETKCRETIKINDYFAYQEEVFHHHPSPLIPVAADSNVNFGSQGGIQ